jgi:hypothetical protein
MAASTRQVGPDDEADGHTVRRTDLLGETDDQR